MSSSIRMAEKQCRKHTRTPVHDGTETNQTEYITILCIINHCLWILNCARDRRVPQGAMVTRTARPTEQTVLVASCANASASVWTRNARMARPLVMRSFGRCGGDHEGEHRTTRMLTRDCLGLFYPGKEGWSL